MSDRANREPSLIYRTSATTPLAFSFRVRNATTHTDATPFALSSRSRPSFETSFRRAAIQSTWRG
jgi:hypothetical protein